MCKPTLEIVRGLLALGMSVVLFASSAWAASTAEIDIEVDAALERFYNEVGGGKDFAEKSKRHAGLSQRREGWVWYRGRIW